MAKKKAAKKVAKKPAKKAAKKVAPIDQHFPEPTEHHCPECQNGILHIGVRYNERRQWICPTPNCPWHSVRPEFVERPALKRKNSIIGGYHNESGEFMDIGILPKEIVRPPLLR